MLESYSEIDLKTELLRLENENLKLKNPEPTIITKNNSGDLAEEEKVNFKEFLKANVKLHLDKSNTNPLRIQNILDIYLLIPIVSTSVKSKYTKIVEEFIKYTYPRFPFTTSKRKLNGISTRGWYSFQLA